MSNKFKFDLTQKQDESINIFRYIKLLISVAPVQLYIFFTNIYTNLSRFYPFSEFFKDKQWHFSNADIRRVNQLICQMSNKLKLNLIPLEIEKNDYFNCFYYKSNLSNFPCDNFSLILAKVLGLPQQNIYVREVDEKINILVPRS